MASDTFTDTDFFGDPISEEDHLRAAAVALERSMLDDGRRLAHRIMALHDRFPAEIAEFALALGYPGLLEFADVRWSFESFTEYALREAGLTPWVYDDQVVPQ